MQAGKLFRKISIQKATESQDSAGAVVLTFEPWLERAAHRREVTGREALQSQQAVAMRECVYEVRSDSETRTITAAPIYRVVDGSQTFDVVAIIPSEQRNVSIGLRVRGRGEVAA